MRSGNIFSLSISSHLGWVPLFADFFWGGVPPSGPDGGVSPSFPMGEGIPPSFPTGGWGSPILPNKGYPPPPSGLDGDTPPPLGLHWGYPPILGLDGVTSGLDGGPPIGNGWRIPPPPNQDWMSYPPPPHPPMSADQETEQLRSRRYVSCVHAGGLSCLLQCIYFNQTRFYCCNEQNRNTFYPVTAKKMRLQNIYVIFCPSGL